MGWDWDWDWDGSPGGRGYRAPYGANKRKNVSELVNTLVCIYYYLGTSNRRTDQCQSENEQHHCRK